MERARVKIVDEKKSVPAEEGGSEKRFVKTPWYKRNYIVDTRIQAGIVLFLAGIAFISSLATFLIVEKSFAEIQSIVTQAALTSHGSMAKEAPIFVQSITESVKFNLVAVILVTVLAFVGAGFWLTHRLAGPIWKLQTELRRLLAGEKVTTVKFRRGDAFQDLPPLINQLIKKTEK